MKTEIITSEKIEIDLIHEISTFILKAGAVACTFIGGWALTCLIGALVNYGPSTMIRGYITAMTGF